MADIDVRIRLLGPLAVDDSGESLSPRLRRLLTALALSRGTQLSESALIDVVWGEDGDLPENPARSLQTYVSRLRALLGPDAIERVGGGYRLVTTEVPLDITEFERLLDRARSARERADDRGAVAELDRALGLWSGDALSEFSTESWAMAEAHRLDELRIDAQEQRAELLVGLDDVDGQLIADLERLALAHPHRDGPTRLLMVAFYRAGRQADALAAFSRHRNQLATDLGLEPSEQLAVLESQILTDDPAVAANARSRPLRGYEIIEQIGEGAFSIVYRGSQPSVGREVAIKQIRAELANRPEFIRNFDTEAHLVARLEHPHIVPLYDYWREPDSAYLVMRLLGGSLETALRSGPLDLDAAVQMVGHVGGALAAAHRAGVVHRDVKPANILLDGEGNAYLADFGIALDAQDPTDTAAVLSLGSPAYASPEQLRREPAGPAADVHGLGIVLYEALAGRLPFPDEPTPAALVHRQLHDPIPPLRQSRPDVPSRLDDVVARATAKAPAERYSSVDEFVDAVQAAVEGAVPEPIRVGVSTSLIVEDRNPYKGLRAFDEADAGDFAGRARLVDQLVAGSTASRLLAVVGPSGSGKSSVVRAGLLPALRAGAVPGSDRWFVTTMLPGPAPFEELETSLLRIAPQRPADLLGVLADGERGIARGVRHAVPAAEGAQVLLVIDQFEELFTLADPAVGRRFLDSLSVALTEERPSLRVILTLRADFYDRPLRHEAIGRLVRDATVAVLPLAADELEQAIVEPAAAVGAMFEPGLVSQIVADVADQPGALPMLQYALTELYEHRVSGLLTQTAYRELGGVAGALGRRAEDSYHDAAAEEQTAIRRIFGRLVTLGEGTEDTRRRARRSELGDDAVTTTVIDRLGEARLLSFDHDPVSREPTVEVAHEALLREWPRLREWLDDDRDGLRILRHLHTTATDWDNANRPPGELYRGGRLEAAEEWSSTHPAELNPIETEFVAASAEARQADIEATQRTERRLRRRLTATAIVAVLALVAGAVAFQQQQSASRSADRAEQEAFDSETGRLIAQATGLAPSNPRAAMLLAVAAYERDPSTATLGGLQQTLIESGPVLQRLEWGTPFLDVEWIAGERLIGTRADGVDLIDLGTGEVENSIALVGATQVVPSSKRTAVDADGSLMAVLSDQPDQSADTPVSGVLSVYSVVDGFDLRFSVPLAGTAANVSMSPSGELIVVSSSTPTESIVTAWLPDGDQRWEVSYPRPDGSTAYVSVTDDQVFVSNSGWLERLDHAGDVLGPVVTIGGVVSVGKVPGPERLFVSDVVEIDGGWIAFGSGNASAVIGRDRGFPTTLELRPLVFPSAARSTGAAVVVGEELLSARSSASVELYDPVTGDSTSLIDLGSGINEALVLSPRGDRYAVAHSLGLTVAALGAGGPLAEAVPRDPLHLYLTISADGTRTVQGSLDDDEAPTPEIWTRDADGWRRDADNPTEAWALEAMVMPDAPNVFFTRTNGLDEKAYRLDTYELLWHWEDLGFLAGDDITDVGPHGPLRAIKRRVSEHEIEVYELGEFEDDPLQTLESPGSPVPGEDVWVSVRFDPAGDRLLVAGPEGDVELWDVASWTTIDPDFFAEQDIAVATWNDDGSIVATASSDGIISIRDGATFEVTREFTGAGAFNIVGSLSLSPDDSLLVSFYAAGQPRLWDVAAGEQIGIDFPTEQILAYSNQDADGLRLVTAAEGYSLMWNLDVDAWPDVACRVAGSNLTAEEWEQLGPSDTERHAICPDYPLPD